jgi:23S rRNA (cytidine2498-2'-O)-methyltransferase
VNTTSTGVIVTAHPEFSDAALRELQRIDSRLQWQATLSSGIILCSYADGMTPREIDALMHQVAEQRPIFVRHIAPVQDVVALRNSEQDIGTLAIALANLQSFSLLERGQRFAVQSRFASGSDESTNASSPKRIYTTGQLNQQLAAAIAEETGAVEAIKKPQIVVSLLCMPDRAYIGISLASENLSDWPGGARHFAQTPEQISRAEFKLLEALEVFGVSLLDHGTALDLGAAPGGWTRLLLEAGMQVVAVDPAHLDPRLRDQKGLEHYRGYAEDYLEEALRKHKKFDLITNDMRMDAREAARLIGQAGSCLRPDGFILSTLKLPHAAKNVDPMKNLGEALRLLEKRFDIVKARQLFHNRQEVTVLTAQPRSSRT